MTGGYEDEDDHEIIRTKRIIDGATALAEAAQLAREFRRPSALAWSTTPEGRTRPRRWGR